MTDVNLLKGRIAALQGTSGADHPGPDMFAAQSANTVTAAERDSFLSHLAICSDCREVAFLTAPSQHEPRVSQSMYWLAFAAAALIASLVCFAPELRSLAARQSVVAVSKTHAPAIIFIPPPPAPAAPKQKPLLVAAPPMLTPRPLPAITLPLPALAANRPGTGVIRLRQTIVEPGPINSMFQTSLLPANARITLGSVPEWNTVADQTALRRSSDGGRTWERISIPDMTGTIKIIDTKSGNQLQIETTTGEHWKTSDAGAHWTRTL